MIHATVFAHCWACGRVKLTADQVELRVCTNRHELSTYTFDCPSCRLRIEQHACYSATHALMSVGTRAQCWALPAEALEAHDGPILTFDDLLDLHEQLAAI